VGATTAAPTIRLRREDIRVHELEVGPPVPLAPATADFNDADVEARPLKESIPQSDSSLILARVEQGFVSSPDCFLLTRRGELVMEALDTAKSEVKAQAAHSQLAAARRSNRKPRLPRAALIGSQRMNAYWHWWIDVVPRIWVVDELAKNGNGDSARELPLLLPELNGFQRQTLELLHVDKRVWPLEQGLHRFGEIVFTQGAAPRSPQPNSPAMAQFAAWARERLGVADPARTGRRLYVSRSDARIAKRQVVNEDEIVARLERRGFEVIRGSELSVADQARVFAEADVVLGPHGAGLTNILFCRPGTPVIELFPGGGDQDVSCYRVLASTLGLPYVRMIVPAAGTGQRENKSAWSLAKNANMTVIADRLEQRLDELEL